MGGEEVGRCVGEGVWEEGEIFGEVEVDARG